MYGKCLKLRDLFLTLKKINIVLFISIGYASNCRVSREDEEKRLEKDIQSLEEEIANCPKMEHLEQEYKMLKGEINHLQNVMGITDASDDSIDEFPIKDEIKEEDIKSEEDDYSSTDDDAKDDAD